MQIYKEEGGNGCRVLEGFHITYKEYNINLM